MDNRKTIKLLSYLPEDLGYVVNKNDPLHIILNTGGYALSVLEEEMDVNMNNLFVNYSDPAAPSGLYYVNAYFSENGIVAPVGELSIDAASHFSGTAEIVDSDDEFKSNSITGLGRGTTLTPDDYIYLPSGFVPSGTFPSGVIGMSYGFDWEVSQWYLTRGDNIVFTCEEDPSPSGLYLNIIDSHNVSTAVQSYNEAGEDEYVNFEVISEEDNYEWNTASDILITLDGFVGPNDITVTAIIDAKAYYFDFNLVNLLTGETELTVPAQPQWIDGNPNHNYNRDVDDLVIEYKYKVAQLNNTPLGSVRLIDIFNMDPVTNDGIILIESFHDDDTNTDVINDYIKVDDLIYFKASKDYHNNVSLDINGDVMDVDIKDGRYIVEYSYDIDAIATYLMQDYKRHFIGLKGSPRY